MWINTLSLVLAEPGIDESKCIKSDQNQGDDIEEDTEICTCTGIQIIFQIFIIHFFINFKYPLFIFIIQILLKYYHTLFRWAMQWI